jgi:hypothetical protein
LEEKKLEKLLVKGKVCETLSSLVFDLWLQEWFGIKRKIVPESRREVLCCEPRALFAKSIDTVSDF